MAEITSETFKPALAYAKSFNKVLTCDLIGVVDIGIVAGLATEIAVSGVSTIRNLDSAKKVMAKNGNYSSEAAEHIFKGNKSGGFHYEGLNDASSRVVEATKKNANGVYEAYVEINGKIKKSPSTFFPKSWTPDQVLNSINKVYETGTYDVTRNIITGKFKGVDIWINLDKAGKIISAFPVIP